MEDFTLLSSFCQSCRYQFLTASTRKRTSSFDPGFQTMRNFNLSFVSFS